MSTLKDLLRKRLSHRAILFSHLARAIWANMRYGFPAHGMLVIGVTGTKGKSTTAHFVASILEEAGYKVGMVTTVDFKIGERIWSNDTNKSNVPPMQLQKLLRDMKDEHCDAVVLEATSIGLDQFRLWGIPFRFVGLTNMGHDHLDYHKTWDNYRAAKLKLFTFRSVRAAVVNAEDNEAAYFLNGTTAKRRWSYAVESTAPGPNATDHVYADKVSSNPGGASFNLVTESGQQRVRLKLAGIFNVENALCAATLCLNLNLRLETIVAGLERLESVAGRLERIETRKGFSIMVDYAHTPDSLEKLYSTLRPDVRGRMIAVLGATGDRDKTKRPIMGALAARFCDYVFITDEEPYTEDPMAIIEEIAKGVPRGRPLFKAASPKVQRQERPILKRTSESGEGDWWWKIADRRDAISRAIDLGKMDDLILVTGMGSQNFKIVGHEKVSWNDRAIIEEILREKKLL